MFIDSAANKTELPRIVSVIKKSGLENYVESVEFDEEAQVITITCYLNRASYIKEHFYNYSWLVDIEENVEGACIIEPNNKYVDMTVETSKPYRLIRISDGAYCTFTVNMEWVCGWHVDYIQYDDDWNIIRDHDYLCDYCDAPMLDEVTILENDTQRSVKVFAPEDGTYTVMFVYYYQFSSGSKKVSFMEMIEYDFKKGVNVVKQEHPDWYLVRGDAVFIFDMSNGFKPVCEAHVVS